MLASERMAKKTWKQAEEEVQDQGTTQFSFFFCCEFLLTNFFTVKIVREYLKEVKPVKESFYTAWFNKKFAKVLGNSKIVICFLGEVQHGIYVFTPTIFKPKTPSPFKLCPSSKKISFSVRQSFSEVQNSLFFQRISFGDFRRNNRRNCRNRPGHVGLPFICFLWNCLGRRTRKSVASDYIQYVVLKHIGNSSYFF